MPLDPLRPSRSFPCLALLGCLLSPAGGAAGGDRPEAPPHLSLFLTALGRIDPERARRWGYEGPVDVSGLVPVWDGDGGGPRFLPAEPASVQEENVNWEKGYHLSGIDGPIFGFTEFEGKLIAGGAFTQAGGAVSRFVAAWDGERWTPLGRGMDFWVVCFAVFRGSLIAGGNFVQADGREAGYVARWDGEAWTALGGGTDGPVWALAVFEDRLIAGGFFSRAGETAARNLAAWDGSGWSELAGGTGGDVLGLLARPGELFVAGDFQEAGGVPARRIARYDGSVWHALGEGLTARTGALAVYEDRLVAGGEFLASGSTTANHLAAWDGNAWLPLGGGTNSGVTQLLVHDGKLFAVGPFTRAEDRPARGIAAWDGGSWQPVGPPLNNRGTAAARYRDQLFVSGFFNFQGQTLAEGSTLEYIGRLEGDHWQPVLDERAQGMNEAVFSLTFFEGDLIAGGGFTFAGTSAAPRVARWNGRTWESMGAGFSHPVNVLKVVEGTLYAGGAFTQTVDGTELNCIARWDGSTWQPMGSGFNRAVFDIEGYYGLLVVAGGMSSTGGRPVNRVAYWDGLAWRSLGSGMTGTVRDLAVHEELLYAAGSFSFVDRDLRYLVRWEDNDWEAVPHPFDAPVATLASMGRTLVAGGYFQPRGGASLRMIAGYDGVSWSPMGSGFDAPVDVLCFHQGSLLAGGRFTKSGTVPIRGLARWSGAEWLPFGSGVSGNPVIPEVVTMAARDDRLFVGGYFSRAGGRVANYLAAWSPYRPASLTGLDAARNGSGAVVTWEISGAAPDSPEFDVYRETPGSARIRLNRHPLWGETSYRFEDGQAPRGEASYWLAELDREGSVRWHGPVTVASIRVTGLGLSQNSPNPFPEDTRIAFQIPEDGRVTLRVYDLRGALVSTLLDAALPEGEHEVSWNGRDGQGRGVSSGIYFVKIESPAGSLIRKMVKQRARE